MEFRLLGSLEVLDGEQRVEVHRPKECALLAMLLLDANHVVDTNRLIEAAWEERELRDPTGSLHTEVSKLRKDLARGRAGASPREFIVTYPGAYELRVDEEQVDFLRFEHLVSEARRAARDEDRARALKGLRQALALWRGPALSDFSGYRFAQPKIVYLEELRLSAFADRAELELSLGQSPDLIGDMKAFLRSLEAVSNIRDHARLYVALVLALYRSDRPDEALSTCEEAERSLYLPDEPPQPVLQDLKRRIVARDPTLLKQGVKPDGDRGSRKPLTGDDIRIEPGQIPGQTRRRIAEPAGVGSRAGQEPEVQQPAAEQQQQTVDGVQAGGHHVEGADPKRDDVVGEAEQSSVRLRLMLAGYPGLLAGYVGFGLLVVVLVLGGAVLGQFSAMPVSPANPAIGFVRIGEPDLDLYCRSEGHRKSILFPPGDAYSIKCVGHNASTRYPVDVRSACQRQYGPDTDVALGNMDDPKSWYCTRQIGLVLASPGITDCTGSILHITDSIRPACELPITEALRGGHDRTVKFWFETSQNGNSNLFSVKPRQNQDESGRSMDLALVGDTGPGGCGAQSAAGLYLHFHDSDVHIASPSLADSKWHYVAVTISASGTLVRVDIDGQEPAGYVWNAQCYSSLPRTQPFRMPTVVNTRPQSVRFGGPGWADRGFVGDLDGADIQPLALEPEALRRDYEQGKMSHAS